MHHQARGTRDARRARQRDGVADGTTDAADQRHAPVDQFGGGVDGTLGLGRREPVEFARIAVGGEDVDARRDGAIDHGFQAERREPVLGVEGGDQDAGDARQGGDEVRRR